MTTPRLVALRVSSLGRSVKTTRLLCRNAMQTAMRTYCAHGPFWKKLTSPFYHLCILPIFIFRTLSAYFCRRGAGMIFLPSRDWDIFAVEGLGPSFDPFRIFLRNMHELFFVEKATTYLYDS